MFLLKKTYVILLYVYKLTISLHIVNYCWILKWVKTLVIKLT